MTDKYIVPEMPTRRMIMTLLKTQGPVGVGSLAAQLGITEMGVRRHLKLMEQDGLIVATIVRQAMGRPTFLYSLSEQGSEQFPRNYDHLLLELLEELDEEQGMEAVYSLFDGRKRKMMKRYAPHIEGRLHWLHVWKSFRASRMLPDIWQSGARKRMVATLLWNTIVLSLKLQAVTARLVNASSKCLRSYLMPRLFVRIVWRMEVVVACIVSALKKIKLFRLVFCVMTSSPCL